MSPPLLKDIEFDVGSFWRRVDKNGPNGCWLWTGGLQRGGYGQFTIYDRRTRRRLCYVAHRASYEMAHGRPEPGLQLDHLCRVRRCVNPAHLEPVTQSENFRRSPLMGRNRTTPVLRAGDIRRLRLARGWTQADLAERVGMTRDNFKRFDNGAARQPRGDEAYRIAAALGVDLGEIAFVPERVDPRLIPFEAAS